MINLSLNDEEVHREQGGLTSGCGHQRHILDGTSKDIVADDALWADFQTRCRQSKEGHTNFNTQQILAEFMEERQRQRQAKAASRATNNETSSLDDMQSLGNRSFSSLDSFRSNPEQESNSNLFQAAANTTRRFRRTTMDMLSNTFEDASASVSSSAQHPPAVSAQPPRARHQRATMSMVSNYVMAVSISSLNRNSSTGNISFGGGKNSSMTSLVGKFVQRARSSLADEEVDSDYD